MVALAGRAGSDLTEIMSARPASGDNCHRPVELAARRWYCVYVSLNRVCPIWAAGDNVTLGSSSCYVPH